MSEVTVTVSVWLNAPIVIKSQAFYNFLNIPVCKLFRNIVIIIPPMHYNSNIRYDNQIHVHRQSILVFKSIRFMLLFYFLCMLEVKSILVWIAKRVDTSVVLVAMNALNWQILFWVTVFINSAITGNNISVILLHMVWKTLDTKEKTRT